MSSANWYFDFVSPFAYLQLAQFDRLPSSLEIQCVPVLFAGLLEHWENKGPAEIPEKRRHTYRFCHWYGERHGIPFRLPPKHPFNPLSALRLSIAAGCDPRVIRGIFDAIFRDGLDIGDRSSWTALADELGFPDVDERTSQPQVKAELRKNTERAAEHGVFGVPTFAVGDQLFWGVDSTDMLIDFLGDPKRFARGEYARVDDLPVGKHRSIVTR